MADILFSEAPIRILQALLSPALDGLFLVVTEAGNGALLIALSLLVYWLWDKRLGLFLGILVLSGAALNALLKSVLGMPRPPPELHLTHAEGNGLPSGHTQYAASFWSALAASFRGPWILGAVLLTVIVALSRVYLGVHYVGDVLGGAGIGIALALGGWLLYRMGVWVRMRSQRKVVVAVLLPSALFGALHLLGQDVLEVWGFLTGFAVGSVMEAEWVGLPRAKGARIVGLRLLIGVPVLVGIYAIGSQAALSQFLLAYSAAFGLVASLLLPWVFVKVESHWGGADSARRGD